MRPWYAGQRPYVDVAARNFSEMVAQSSIRIRPGVAIDAALMLLRELQWNCRVDAAPPGTSDPGAQQVTYVRWAQSTESRLRSFFDHSDVRGLFDDLRHRDICSMAPGAQLPAMIHSSLDGWSRHFEQLADGIDSTRALFEGAAVYLVPDTSFYIGHPEKFETLDFHALVGRQAAIRVLIPMVVIDELDHLKDRGPSQHVRWRARHTVAVIDNAMSDPPVGILHDATSSPPRGAVTLQVLFDPPGRVRLPINDDEIIDRCVASMPFADEITLVTYDTGQSTRARMAGLKVRKLTHDPGPEPNIK